ncbi:MAG: hypothetical protein HRU32_10690 [Rhodobacteraceae bacterium]|nr:hypothetical protein [Paracoccaceae bacterium]
MSRTVKKLELYDHARNFSVVARPQSELHEIASSLHSIAEDLQNLAGSGTSWADKNDNTLSLSEKLISHRTLVDEIFEMPGFVSSPAWDIILDLYLALRQNRRLSVSSVCVGKNHPPTTVLRWIKLLEEKDLIDRQPDPLDKRRIWLSLRDQAQEKAEIILKEF